MVRRPGTAMRRPGQRCARVGGRRPPGDDPRAVAVAHGRAAPQQRVPVGEVGVGVDRHGGDLELAGQRAAVERLDVGELVRVAQLAGVELVVRERPEHEGVVGVGAVGDLDHLGHGKLRFVE